MSSKERAKKRLEAALAKARAHERRGMAIASDITSAASLSGEEAAYVYGQSAGASAAMNHQVLAYMIDQQERRARRGP